MSLRAPLRGAVLIAAMGCGACTLAIVPPPATGASTGSTGEASSSSGASATSTSGAGASASSSGSSSGGAPGTTGGTTAAATTSGSTTGPPYTGPPPVFVGIIGSGQSLSVGVYGTPILSNTTKYDNLKLEDDGPDPRYAFDGGGLFSLVPLLEPIRPVPLPGWSDDQYPNNLYGETPHTALANQLTALSLAADAGNLISIQTVVGWSGHCLSDIDKEGTGRAYPGSLAEARVAAALARDAGRTLRYDAVVLTHGECDDGNLDYEAGLLQFWSDYNFDLPPITGQDGGVVLIETQQSTVDPYPDGTGSMLEQWQAGVDHPGQIICAGPKYQYNYAPDNLHLPAAGYIRLGEKYAEVIAAIEAGRGWTPLQPSGVTHVGNTVTVSFQDSFPPLNWDDNQPPGHQTVNTAWATGRGFEVTDLGTGDELPISSAALSGDSVVLTLGFDPDAGVIPDGGIKVGYAMTGDALGTYEGGQPSGRHGALRDSDPLVGIDAQTLSVQVTQGSVIISGLFNYRAIWDRVSSAQLPAETVVVGIDSSYSYIGLSNPWPGPTGTAELTFWHEERNYCVDFQMSAP